MQKEIKNIQSRAFKETFPGLFSVDTFHGENAIEPYLVFTEYKMTKPVFGPHPHAGVSVITYMHPDSVTGFRNRDSHGDDSIIDAGGVHITQAGNGIMHDEVPEVTGKIAHGFQIWVNHSNENRLVAPKALHADAKDIPEVKIEGGKVRVIHGSFKGIESPVKMVTPVQLYDVYLEANQEIKIPAEIMTFVSVTSGDGIISNSEINPQDIIYFEEDRGTEVSILAGQDGINFVFASGVPHKENIVFGGPYVMSTNEQLREAQIRFSKGEMGSMKSLPISN